MLPKIVEWVKKELYLVNEYGFDHQSSKGEPSAELIKYFAENYSIRTDVHRMCIACQIRQITKYADFNSGETEGFQVECSFVPKGLPPNITSKKLKEVATKLDIPEKRAKQVLLSTIDPVSWAELMFGFDDNNPQWRLRPYQKEQLRCNAKRMALREGRRCGKTFGVALKLINYVFNNKIELGFNAEGEQVIRGPHILVITPYSSQLEETFEAIESLLKRNPELASESTTGTGENLYTKTPFYRMEFKNGSSIKGFVSGLGIKQDQSGGGAIRGKGGEVIYLDEMDMIPDEILRKVVDPILTGSPDTILIATSTPIGKLGKFRSYCLPGETYIVMPSGIKTIRDVKIGDTVIGSDGEGDRVKGIFKRTVEGELREVRASYIPSLRLTPEHPVLVNSGATTSDAFVEAGKLSKGRMNIYGRVEGAHYVRIPITPHVPSLDIRKALLNRFVDKGKTRKVRETLHLSSREAAKELGWSLWTVQNLRKRYRKEANIIIDARKGKSFVRALDLYKKIKETDGYALGLYLAEGTLKRSIRKQHISAVVWSFHIEERHLAEAIVQFAKSLGLKCKLTPAPARTVLLVEICNTSLANLFAVLFGFCEEKRIPAYISHSHPQWRLFLKGVLDGDGYQSGQTNPSTKSIDLEGKWSVSLTAYNTMYRLWQDCLLNGMRIGLTRGWNAETKRRKNRKETWTLYTVLGDEQKFFMRDGYWYSRIYSNKAINFKGEVYNLETERTNTYVAEGWAVHNCLSRPDFKEDFYPSTVLEHWNQVKKEVEEEGTTRDSFLMEYMAQFLEGTYGVFKPSYIQAARRDYEYFVSRDRANLRDTLGISDINNILVAMGIDWNKRAGTEFYLVGYSPSIKQWFGLEAVNIPATEFSAKRWIRELVDLNYRWRPNWIYADKGYGHTIIEDVQMLSYQLRAKQKKTPVDEETIKLLDRLVPYDFSSNIIMKSPIDGQDIKKGAKEFLVENAVRTLEEGLFIFPHSDEVLRKQLGNYIIERRHATTGRPIYGMESEKVGDHRLDACMLALAALTLEESIYAGRNIPFSAPKFLEKNLLQREAPSEGKGERLLRNIEEGKVSGHFSILHILHQKHLEEDEEKKEFQRTSNLRHGRSMLGKEEKASSFLELLREKAGSPEGGEFISLPQAAKRPSRRGLTRDRGRKRGF